ncbi:hypothetical protein [Caldicellulosiruptor acetigenus]|uniref:hypothetical protein n=1 Tax=Caldicellulosiruptor acetigenus TaxID=301953 RepID=UPI0005A0C098|nr:hypothetical protein [Caldicellulosiruptor acetigenus]
MLDANKLQKVKKYYGIGFVWDSRKENIYYALPQPHFSNLKGREKICKNDKVIFETSDSESILRGPYMRKLLLLNYQTHSFSCIQYYHN